MKKSNTTLWMSVVLVLVGCNSFNHYELKEDPVQNYASKSIWDSFVLPEKKLDGTVAQSEPTCPPFQLPDVPKQPDLPYQKIANVKPNDSMAIDEINTTYIAELRRHNKTVITIFNKAYNSYMEKCAKYVSEKAVVKK